MTNFDFFREKCNNTRFSSHVFFKSCVLETIECDYERLDLIAEDDILYFEGAWQTHETKNSNRCIRYFNVINTFSEVQIGEARAHSDNDIIPIFRLFGADLLFGLSKIGVNYNIVDALINRLYEEYDQNEQRMHGNNHNVLSRFWESYYVKEWRERYCENFC